jgi:predicted metal-dependent enzyme (double-stranded beta helix superfamily)
MGRRLSDADHDKDPRLAQFVEAVHEIVDRGDGIAAVVAGVAERVRDLLCDWRMPDPRYLERQPGCRYGSYLLYRAPDTSFVVVIDTFDQGQTTQIHNHRTWAVVGLLDGAEHNEIYRAAGGFDGPPQRQVENVTRPGEVFTMMETDMHRLRTDQGTPSLSFHVYGADVGIIRRVVWNEGTGCYNEFQQGWSNDAVDLPIYLDCPVMTELQIRQRCLGYL